MGTEAVGESSWAKNRSLLVRQSPLDNTIVFLYT